MQYNFIYEHNSTSYEVVVTKKRMKNGHFRFRDGKFYVSCPYLFSKERIVECLDKFADKLLKTNIDNKMEKEDSLYVLGDKYNKDIDGMYIYNGYKFKDAKDLEIRCKKSIQQLIETRVRYYEKIMNVPSYKVRVQKMTSRYGSNSKRTNSLNFSLSLIHYSLPIIDSVVVHELAHYYYFDHSQNFYNVVYKYCPKYDYYRKCLIKGKFHD